MKIFSTKNIRRLDSYTINNEPISSLNLMERAASTIFSWILKKFPKSHPFYLFVGPGNNGGDALVLARLLFDEGYAVHAFTFSPHKDFSNDAFVNLERLKRETDSVLNEIYDIQKLPEIDPSAIIVDALFGSGLSRPLEGLYKEVVSFINQSHAKVVSVDIPSGLFGENNSHNNPKAIVKADYTVSFQFPKLAFFFADCYPFTGDWIITDIGLHPTAIKETPTDYFFLQKETFASVYKNRKKFDHKGTYGHALLIAGSYGKMGAAVLASKACLRTGVGLLTTHIPHGGYNVLQIAVPEAMVNIDRSELLFSEFPDLGRFKAIGVGPGIDTKLNTQRALKNLIEKCQLPLVMDADALNILSQHPDWLPLLKPGTILTPHPKEFERLVGVSHNCHEQLEKLKEMAQQYKIILVLKGAYTSIALPDGTVYFNETGNPGMATAGSGDVLTGIILSLLAQGYPGKEAALLGVYLHGLAGDLAASDLSLESLVAGDICLYLGKAFRHIQSERP